MRLGGVSHPVKSSKIRQGDRLPEASRFNPIEAFVVNFGMDSMLIDQAQSWLKASVGQGALKPSFVADRNVPKADVAITQISARYPTSRDLRKFIAVDRFRDDTSEEWASRHGPQR